MRNIELCVIWKPFSNAYMFTTVIDVLLHYSTLYCAKGNYEFGISRVIKSLEPYSRKVRI